MNVLEKIVLSSASPRRKQLLETVGIPFIISVPDVEELHFRDPVRSVRYNARLKAGSGMERYSDKLVLGVDTVVVTGGKVLGKPGDLEEARRYLRMLSGRWHTVYSGICLTLDGRNWEGVERTGVLFDRLSDGEISRYVDRCRPLDKAGAYGIQEFSSMFIRRIKGDYFNVVGLPLNLLYRLMKQAGYDFTRG